MWLNQHHFDTVARLVNFAKIQKMSVMRSPVSSFSTSAPIKNPLTGTPKHPRTASDDDQVFHTHIEELISSSIKTELSKIGDTLTASILETVQQSVKTPLKKT